MKTCKRVGSFLLFCFLFETGFSQDVFSVFEAANRAYESQNFDGAIEKYEQILGGGYRSAALHFNLGNAYAQRQKTARSILNLERSLRLSPRDAAATQSLDFAKKQIIDDVPTVSGRGLFGFFENLCRWGGTRFWNILSISGLWLGVGGLIVWLLKDDRTWKKRGFLTAIVVFPLVFCGFGLAYGAFLLENKTNLAIVMQAKTGLKVSSDEAAAETQSLSEGIEVEMKENFGKYTKIKLPNGAEGWVLTQNLEKI